MANAVADRRTHGVRVRVRCGDRDARKRAARFIVDRAGDGTIAALRKCAERYEEENEKQYCEAERLRMAHADSLRELVSWKADQLDAAENNTAR